MTHVPPAYPVLGHLPHLARNPLEFMQTLGHGHDVVPYRMGWKTFYLVNQPELIREIMLSSDYQRTPNVRRTMASFLGEGLLSQEGTVHLRQRRLMQPAFHREYLNHYFAVMREETEATLERWTGQHRVNVVGDMRELTLKVVSRALFTAQAGNEQRELSEALERLLPAVDAASLRYTLVPERFPIRYGRAQQQDIRTLAEITDWLIQSRKALRSDERDLLSMLLAARDADGSRLSDDELRGQALTLLLAGHETSANTLNWAWYLLGRHPEAQARLHDELDQVLGGAVPTLEDLGKLKYTEWVVKETLRLYPVAWLTLRCPIKDVVLGGQAFKAGTPLSISVAVTHRDPRYFERPLEFWPERFEKESSMTKFAYLPFGAGGHICIGQSFAMMEMKLALAALAGRYTLELDPGFVPTPRTAITLGMLEHMEANLHPRRVAAAAN